MEKPSIHKLEENLIFEKPKHLRFYRYIILILLISGGAYLIYTYFNNPKDFSLGRILLYFNMILLSLVNGKFWHDNVLEMKSNRIKVTVNLSNKYSFNLDDILHIDRHFDEWTFFLKNDKKYNLSQSEIQKKDIPRFRDFMLQIPKKIPTAYL